MKKFFVLLLSLVFVFIVTIPAIAGYPEKPVRFVVTHPAGGSTDLPIRTIAPFDQ